MLKFFAKCAFISLVCITLLQTTNYYLGDAQVVERGIMLFFLALVATFTAGSAAKWCNWRERKRSAASLPSTWRAKYTGSVYQ